MNRIKRYNVEVVIREMVIGMWVDDYVSNKPIILVVSS